MDRETFYRTRDDLVAIMAERAGMTVAEFCDTDPQWKRFSAIAHRDDGAVHATFSSLIRDPPIEKPV